MRILHIGPKNYPPSYGGVEKVVYDIVSGLEEGESHVMVEWEQCEEDNIKILPKGFVKQVKFIFKYSNDKNISVLHFHKEAFVLHAILATFFGYKTLVNIHGCPWRVKKWNMFYRSVFYILDLLACSFVNGTIFVGERDWRHFSRIFFWKKINFIPNGIKTTNHVCSKNTDECIFIGRISVEKNVLELVKIFKNKEKKLTIFGPLDNHNQEYGEKVIQEIQGSNNIKYGGVLPFSKVLPTLKQYNTFYNLSSSEGMPIAVLEAASIGMNLVLSDIPQHRDLGFSDVKYINLKKISKQVPAVFNSYSMTNKDHTNSHFPISRTIGKYKNLYIKSISGLSENIPEDKKQKTC